MARFYDPLDKHSSPRNPIMGSIVKYRAFRQGRAPTAGQEWPAMIIRVLKDASGKPFPRDAVDLKVFTSHGDSYITNVPFSTDDLSENTWGWLPEATLREIQPSAKPVAEATKA